MSTLARLVKKGKTFYRGLVTTPIRRRRHGKELEAALLAAAWEELAGAGYARLTMESIATRARTSEAVLYRRWPNKQRLVLAAIEHHRAAHPVELPDTGELRGDLIAYLTVMSEARAGYFAVVVAAAFSGLMADTGLTPTQARTEIMGPQPPVRELYRRAHERGELDVDRVPPGVLALPFDLARHDLLMDPRPLDRARITSIVDDCFLPLVRGR